MYTTLYATISTRIKSIKVNITAITQHRALAVLISAPTDYDYLYGITSCCKRQQPKEWDIRISTLGGKRISMKLGIYNYVAGMTTHGNPCGAATTWVVSANT